MITSLKAAQSDDLAWLGSEPPQACAAWPKDPAADPVGRGRKVPVGRGRGVPVPLDGRRCGSVTPWRSRHCRKAEFCDVPEPDDDEDDELAPQPATAGAAVSTTAPSTPGLAARPGRWRRRVNNVSLTDYGPAHVAPGRARQGVSPCAVHGLGLAISLRAPESFLSEQPRLSAVHAAATAVQVTLSTLAASGSRTRKAAP
jgi:hypothetical protein